MLTIDFTSSRKLIQWSAVKQSVRAVAQSSNTMMWICYADGYCIFLNHPWYQFTDQVAGEGEGSDWLNGVHPDDRAAASKAFVDAVALIKPYQVDYRLRRRGDHFEWVSASGHPFFDDQGEVIGYLGSDISREALLKARGEAGSILTKRERETINWAAQGLTSADTAVKMGITPRTVESFLTSAAVKLGSINRTQTVVEAIRRGEIVL